MKNLPNLQYFVAFGATALLPPHKNQENFIKRKEEQGKETSDHFMPLDKWFPLHKF